MQAFCRKYLKISQILRNNKFDRNGQIVPAYEKETFSN